VVGLALSAAATYARYQVRVNCVAPGLTRTPLTAALTRSEAVVKASAAMHPLGRIGEPEEVARAIQWFLDPGQSWVTGQVLGVDGGLASVQARAGA
jgi:NAD(P)-dependent dehydrogenase (short-subunit alcohol dehydrogenase family)